MGLRRRGFIWTLIILEVSLIIGAGLYFLIHPDNHNNEGGLVLPTEFGTLEYDPALSLQETEIADDEDRSSVEQGGPYTVSPFLHVSIYRARNGDNLWSIAKKNDLDFYTILSINRLEKANRISIGQKLKIPNQRGILHTVFKGETLEDVALMYNVGIRKIIRVNRILDPNDIRSETDLFIPDARITDSFSKELLKKSGIPPQFDWPCRQTCRISSRFGYRKDPFTGQRAFHHGVDLAPGYGASVKASMGGLVTHAGWMGGYGKLVVIKHNNVYSTRYGHLSQILVKKGRYVAQGQNIGKVGNTGRSTGAHLHFEIRENGKPKNPLGFIHR